ncbi:phosphoglucosamine mutase [Nakamurella sp. YIM 132087]|uniref:Phosphoglucosamine mutase n=1 Tax=Nakamurella alba TaxID=2665158 RepID=A0A7K1FNL2_9ACTN|nr:phosphoglucosamine mutase [Nakamurella alba]MTD14374.1 phosphoglucosamine mutase [Nakamurella alba]
MGRLFGTDGVRGLANADLTPVLALELATSAARVLTGTRAVGVSGPGSVTAPAPSGGPGRVRPVAVVGRDPRASGEMLEAAVAAGLASAGVDVVLLGVLPTPGVAYLTGETGAALGVVISASHNPMPDNGIKIFAAGGRKLDDAVEDAIEADMQATPTEGRPVGAEVGRIRRDEVAVESYLQHLRAATPHDLTGLRIVVDCAHGAASELAPEAYRRAGAEVVVIGGDPDGLNINEGVGSTHLDGLRAAVLEHGADLGVAHDGDADRCLAIAGDGSDVDGDAILAILATSLAGRGELAHDTVVGTVMANIGFHRAMAAAGITVRTTAVGDRYVLEEMREGGYSLGGEQSGHIVLADHGTTGDGILTGLQLMARVAETGRTLADLASIVQRFPQVLLNVRVTDKSVAGAASVLEAVAAAEAELGDAGRVLLRPSGTEPLVRVMVEAATTEQAGTIAERIAKIVADAA